MAVPKAAIEAQTVQGRLPCARAFQLAEKQGVTPSVVGKWASRFGIKISRCQLGLFGYEDLGKRRILEPADEVVAKLKGAVDAQVENGKITCKSIWGVAAELSIPRLHVAKAVEALGLKITSCQLGCFR
jgi:hypothetical protein